MIRIEMPEDMFEKELEELRRNYRNGDRHALVDAIGLILNQTPRDSDAVFPIWLDEALEAIYDKFTMGELESWEDVLGKPYPGKSRKARVKLVHSVTVWRMVENLKKEGHPVDEYLFEVVAEQLKRGGRGIGKGSVVRDLYYSMRRRKSK